MDLHVSLASLVGLGTHYQLPSFRCRSKIQDGLRAVRGRQMQLALEEVNSNDVFHVLTLLLGLVIEETGSDPPWAFLNE